MDSDDAFRCSVQNQKLIVKHTRTTAERKRQQPGDGLPSPAEFLETRLLDSIPWTEGKFCFGFPGNRSMLIHFRTAFGLQHLIRE